MVALSSLNQQQFASQLTALLPSLSKSTTLYLAYSGGCDSQVLLHLLDTYTKSQGLTLKALHLNHGLSSNAAAWQSFCHAQCDSLGVQCLSEQAELSNDTPNLEAMARVARQQFFAKHVTANDVLLTAHHQTDQAETLLHRAVNGAGARGVAGMAATNQMNGLNIARPLLSYSRSQIEKYAQQQGLEWVEDESNADTRFDRNYLRREVLPVLKKRWPQAEQGLARSATKAADAWQLLQDLGKIDLQKAYFPEYASALDLAPPLSWPALQALSSERIHNAIDVWLLPHCRYPLVRSQLYEWLRQVRELSDNDSHPVLQHEDIELQYYDQRLHLLSVYEKVPIEELNWDLQAPLALPNLALQLCADLETPATTTKQALEMSVQLAASDTVYVAWRAGGERVYQPGRVHSQAYKKCLQDARVAPWLRERLPLIKFDGNIVWSGSLGQLAPVLFNHQGEQVVFSLEQSS